MLKLVANGVNKVNSFLEKRLESSFQFITPFAWIGIIGFPLYFFILKLKNYGLIFSVC